MCRIFINGFHAKASGGRSVLKNFLAVLRTSSCEERYFVLVPSLEPYEQYECENINLIELPLYMQSALLSPIVDSAILTRLLDKLDVDILLNLADVPIPTDRYQIFLFDWSYAVYPESIVWQRMSYRDWLHRKAKVLLFRRWLRYVDVVVAQSSVMKRRLESLYDLNDVKVVPNAVSLENLNNAEECQLDLPDGIRLLCLSYYYPHKNHEILLELAELIRQSTYDFKIVTTISRSQGRHASDFLDKVAMRRLESVICNIGPVSMSQVPSLYKNCSALLLPTLLESFSGTYVEAMFNDTPIFTSDLDFARDICGDAAFYFNPLDASSILRVLEGAFGSLDALELHKANGRDRLNSFMKWEEVVRTYRGLIYEGLTAAQ